MLLPPQQLAAPFGTFEGWDVDPEAALASAHARGRGHDKDAAGLAFATPLMLYFVLRVLRQGLHVATVHDMFGLSEKVARNHLRHGMWVLFHCLQNEVSWPDAVARLAHSKLVERLEPHLSGVVAFGDGTPLSVIGGRGEYWDYNTKYGRRVCLCAVWCDLYGRIVYISTGAIGASNDASVFKASSLYQKPETYFMDYEFAVWDGIFSGYSELGIKDHIHCPVAMATAIADETGHLAALNHQMRKLRQVNECVMAHIKNWRIVRDDFFHQNDDEASLAFWVVAHLQNLRTRETRVTPMSPATFGIVPKDVYAAAVQEELLREIMEAVE